MGLSILTHAVLYLKYDDLDDIVDYKISYDRINEILKGLGYSELSREDWMDKDDFSSDSWNTTILNELYEDGIYISNLKYASGYDSIDIDSHSIAFYINFYQSEVELETLIKAGHSLKELNQKIQDICPSQNHNICFRTTML